MSAASAMMWVSCASAAIRFMALASSARMQPVQQVRTHPIQTSAITMAFSLAVPGATACGQPDYNNVFAGINLTPSIAWSHDVDGYGPNFSEGTKAVSLGLNADYQNTYNASLSYTDFFGGDYNTNVDRDFVALSFGVNF